MNGMLQHQRLYEQEIERHQQEARRWAHEGTLGRLAQGARAQSRVHPRRARLFAVLSPMAVALGVLAILI
jgi:hypothetical protein